MHYFTYRNETHEVIKYLEYCVHRLHNEDPGVHNLLLSLYAKQVGTLAFDFLDLSFNYTAKLHHYMLYCIMCQPEYHKSISADFMCISHSMNFLPILFIEFQVLKSISEFYVYFKKI